MMRKTVADHARLGYEARYYSFCHAAQRPHQLSAEHWQLASPLQQRAFIDLLEPVISILLKASLSAAPPLKPLPQDTRMAFKGGRTGIRHLRR